jgi:predicted RNase H-like nuclease (RuvC/YqgF family)
MKTLLHITLVFLVAGLPSAGFGEFYRYKSPSGVTIYTDDLSKVPEDQRPMAVPYEETVSSGEEAESEETREESISDGQTETRETRTEEPADEITVEALKERKIALDQEYADLLKEKKDLENTKSKFDSKEELSVYHEKIVNLNERISDYEAERQEFSRAVDAFNAKQDHPASIDE